ncbi:MAG: parallel beta-helix domain-containing protein [Pseudomonadota bacterium]
MHTFRYQGLTAILLIAVAACTSDSGPETVADATYQETLQLELLDAKPGTVITIPEGVFSFDRSLSLAVDGVTIRGAGMDKSILTFKDQVAGAEGLLVTASDFTIEDLAIEDTRGDALKVTEGNNIVIRRVRTEWTGGHKTSNGAYGIYPVQTTNVLMEGNVAIDASDAGLYIGQSKNVIVRGNRAEYNVAGIEIENTIDADVYDNVATNNTGGILVFNMPNLQQEGKSTRVFNNQVFDNNTDNFGHKGTPVASVPAGSGIVVNSNDNVEIFGNEIRNNRTANVIVSSVYSTNYGDGDTVDGYDPYPEAIYIYDNVFEGGGDAPDGLDLKALKLALYGFGGAFPDVIWDGFADNAKLIDGQMPIMQRICVNNGDVKVLNADGPNDYSDPREESTLHDCDLPKLPSVVLGSAG